MKTAKGVSMLDRRRPRHIAPRLSNGDKRVSNSGALPPKVKYALQMVAAARGESLSWVLEQLYYEHFHLKVPDYIGKRTATPIAPTADPKKIKLVEDEEDTGK